MHQAQVTEWGQPPQYIEAEDVEPSTDQVRLKLVAAGVHNVVRSRAEGKHYSASSLPHIPGTDGVGLTPDDKLVYFTTFTPTGGSLSEFVNVPKQAITPLPSSLDPVQTAALINPALSSWMSMKTRASLPEDFTVLIIGATSASGRIAIPLAKALGAKKVIGVARGDMSGLGLDEFLNLTNNVDFSTIEVDVVLDYVYGPVAEQLFRTVRTPRPVQYVQIGTLSGAPITLPGDLLRSKNITIRGSGPGAWSLAEAGATLPALLEAMQTVPAQPVRTAKLKDIETEWTTSSKERLVFVP